jgi:hypothetical protein
MYAILEFRRLFKKPPIHQLMHLLTQVTNRRYGAWDDSAHSGSYLPQEAPMSKDIRIKRGESFEFPVPPSHPLARHQRLRVPSRDDVLKSTFYSAAVERQISLIPARSSESLRNSILDGIIGSIGVGNEIVLDGQNIIVEEGAYMSIKGSWTWLTANSWSGTVAWFASIAPIQVFPPFCCCAAIRLATD